MKKYPAQENTSQRVNTNFIQRTLFHAGMKKLGDTRGHEPVDVRKAGRNRLLERGGTLAAVATAAAFGGPSVVHAVFDGAPAVAAKQVKQDNAAYEKLMNSPLAGNYSGAINVSDLAPHATPTGSGGMAPEATPSTEVPGSTGGIPVTGLPEGVPADPALPTAQGGEEAWTPTPTPGATGGTPAQ